MCMKGFSTRKMSNSLATTTTTSMWEIIKSDKIRLYRTANLYLSYLSLGLVMNLPGVTLPDLERNVGVSTTKMGYILTLRFVGYCVGSLSAGFVFERVHRLVLFTLILFTMSGGNLAVPFIHDYYLLVCIMVLLAFAMGSLDTGANVLCLDLWMKDPGPFFQGLHLSYGLGAFICPLIAEPFLSPEDEEPNNSTMNNAAASVPPVKDIGNVVASYSIVSGIVFLIGISSLVSFLIDRTAIKSNTEKERVTNRAPGKLLPRLLTGLGMIFLAGYASLETNFSQFLTTFVINSHLKMSKSTGSFMTSTFWGTFCFGRAYSVILATRFKPLHLLFFNLSLISCAGIVLSIFGEEHSEVMWGGTALLGFGCASTWPSSFSFMENYIGISNFVSGLFVVSGSAGGFLLSLLVNEFMQIHPSVFLYSICICAGVCITSLAGQIWVVCLIEAKRGRILTASSIEYLDKTEHIS